MSDVSLRISIANQNLEVLDGNGHILNSFDISSAANGSGQMMGSECTPMGKHVIRAKIGDGQPVNTIYRGRRPTGEIYQPGMCEQQPDRDWILTRILWLSGCEQGFNRLGDVDSMRRYIYIHGTPDEVDLTVPGSKGCIRIKNNDLLKLFDLVSPGTKVEIVH